jgi:hypothetical protein
MNTLRKKGLKILERLVTILSRTISTSCAVRKVYVTIAAELPTVDTLAIRHRFLLSIPRFLWVNITSPHTSKRLPEDFHKHGPLQEFEQLNLSQLTLQLQPTQGHYALRAAIMYSRKSSSSC